MGVLTKCCFRFSTERRSMQRIDSGEEADDREFVNDKDGSLPVRRYGWGEMEDLTRNFSLVIGSGGYSTVYLGRVTDSDLGAFKVNYSSERLNRVFKQELDILLRLNHENIVKLLGYCDERDEGVLIFEYLSNGTLEEKLHTKNPEKNKPEATLLWKTRMSIAHQLAKAIEYLHGTCDPHIVHGDIKTSNIVLHENNNLVKLCDFGSAKTGFSSSISPNLPSRDSSTRQRMMVGSPGYVDPHYLRTGIASKKNDIYGFGVVLLELITGEKAFCSEKNENLANIIGPLVNNGVCGGDVAKMVDPMLGGRFDMDEAMAMVELSGHCLRQLPGRRPSSSEILRTMKQRVSSSVPFV